MVANRDHHYVPQFYLRQFASASRPGARSICLHVIERNQTIRGASIRDQCYRPWFYGRDGAIELDLGRFEAAAAAVIRAVELSRIAPSLGSENDRLLKLFVGIQGHRTSRRLAELRVGDTKFVEVVFGGDRSAADRFFGGELPQIGIVDLLNLAPIVVGVMMDLNCVVIAAAGGNGFLTSDHPVALYNQYCEDYAESWGTTGSTAKGLQVLLPLSPRTCLLLFDSGTYFIPARSRGVPVRASRSDLDAINSLQVLSADSCLYFPEETSEARVVRALKKARDLRGKFGPRITQAIAEDDSNRSLIHQYLAVPNLHLNLSFLKLKPEARSVPAKDRLNQDRPEVASILRALERQMPSQAHETGSSGAPRNRSYLSVRAV